MGVNSTNGDFDDGMKQMWTGTKEVMGKYKLGDSHIKEQRGKMISSSKGKRRVPIEHHH